MELCEETSLLITQLARDQSILGIDLGGVCVCVDIG